MFNANRGRSTEQQVSFRGRSGSRGRFSYRGGYNAKRTQQRNNKKEAKKEEVKTEDTKDNVANPNQQEVTKRIEVKGYEIKDAEISTSFRDWIEPDRKNILIDLDNKLEDQAIEKYQPKIEQTILERRQQDKMTGLKNIFIGGMKLSIAVRILRTLSQTQRLKAPTLQEIVKQIKDFEIPNSLNIIFGQIGKFSDESFGNGRIIGANLFARRKILEAVTYIDTYDNNTNWSYKDHDAWKAILQKTIDLETIVWRDADSLEWLKFEGSSIFKNLNDKAIKVKIKDNSHAYIRFPEYDFENRDISKAITYIKRIKDMEFDFEDYDEVEFGPWNGKSARDVFASFVIISAINGEFYRSNLPLDQFYTGFKNSFVAKLKVSDLLDYFQIVDGSKILDDQDIIMNAFEAHSVYSERIQPLIRPIIKVSNLDNSEFGSISQLIEVDELDKRRKWSNGTDFKSISAFKNKTQVVLGGLIGYSKRLIFRRTLQGHLSANRGNIYGKIISLDDKG